MQTIPIDSILVGEERQRQHFDVDRLSALSESIQVTGLLQPIILQSDNNPVLVSGERRLRAIKLLWGRGHTLRYCGKEIPDGEIPYVMHNSPDLYAAELAELDENIHRDDLPWQEKNAAITRLHRIRQTLNPQQSATDTAKEVWGDDFHSGAAAQVKEALLLQEHMDRPEVAKAKTKKEALRTVRKGVADGIFKDLAANTTVNFSDHSLLRGDARELMKELPDEKFSCIITDPPYGIGANKFGDQAIGDHEYNDNQEYFEDLMRCFAMESIRVSASQAHAYVFCDPRRYSFLELAMASAGWDVWATPLIWYKGNMGLLPRPDHGPRRTYEMILYAIKGNRKIVKAGQHDVIHIPSVGSERHAAEKPVSLYTELLSRSVRPGEFILDPFAGSGPVFPAANKLSLKATGINLDERDYALALSRLEEQ